MPVQFLLLAAAVAATQTPPPAAASGCASVEDRQFDFWVGRWDVYAFAKPDRKVAESLIERRYKGCAIWENWQPGTDGGGSLSSYAPAEKVWKQTWVDNTGSRADFTGGWTGKAMILTGIWPQPDHPTQLTRMTYTPLPDAGVRQMGETSDDRGKTWQPSFDFIYRKAKD